MRDELWFDKQTRAVGITMNVYNTMTRYLTVSRYTIEIRPSGRVFKRGEYFTFQLQNYQASGNGSLRLVLEVFIGLYFCYFLQKELKKPCRMGFKQYFFKRTSTIVEVGTLMYTLTFFVLYWNLVIRMQTEHKFTHFHVLDPTFTDFYQEGLRWQTIMTVGGLLFLVGAIKLIKYMSLNKTAMLLFRTVSEASGILGSFLLVMLTLLVFFAVATHYVYGTRVPEFSGYLMALLQMIRWILGDVNYELLDSIRPDMTPVLYTAHQIIFFFLAMNMLIAIVISQFEIVKTKAQHASKWKREVPALTQDLMLRWYVFAFRCKRRCCCDQKALKILEMPEDAAKRFVRSQKKRDAHGMLVPSFEWRAAHERVLKYWERKKQVDFQKWCRRLMRLGKSTEQGAGVNLYQFLERLYNSWEQRAEAAISSGDYEYNDSRLPIACISAERLAFFVCKTASFETREVTRHNRASVRASTRASTRTRSRSGEVSGGTENGELRWSHLGSASQGGSRMGSERAPTAQSTMTPDENGSNRVVIRSKRGSQVSDKKSLHSRRLCGKLRDACRDCARKTAACCRCIPWCKARSKKPDRRISAREQILIDERYAGFANNGRRVAEHVVRSFYACQSSLIVAPIVADSTYWTNDESIVGEKLRLVLPAAELKRSLYEVVISVTNSALFRKNRRHVFVDTDSAQLYVLEPCDLRSGTRMDVESDGSHEPGVVAPKATGPIRMIIDLLDLQQIHTDCTRDNMLRLCLDDQVGRSFALRFRNARRRATFVDAVVDTCAQFQGEIEGDQVRQSGASTKTVISVASSQVACEKSRHLSRQMTALTEASEESEAEEAGYYDDDEDHDDDDDHASVYSTDRKLTPKAKTNSITTMFTNPAHGAHAKAVNKMSARVDAGRLARPKSVSMSRSGIELVEVGADGKRKNDNREAAGTEHDVDVRHTADAIRVRPENKSSHHMDAAAAAVIAAGRLKRASTKADNRALPKSRKRRTRKSVVLLDGTLETADRNGSTLRTSVLEVGGEFKAFGGHSREFMHHGHKSHGSGGGSLGSNKSFHGKSGRRMKPRRASIMKRGRDKARIRRQTVMKPTMDLRGFAV